MVESITKHPYVPRQTTYKNVEIQTHSLTLKEEEIEIRPRMFMRSYQSNETTELQKQPPIEEPST